MIKLGKTSQGGLTVDAGKSGTGGKNTYNFFKEDNAMTVVSKAPSGMKVSSEIDRKAKDHSLKT